MLELCDWVTVLRDGVRTADQSLAGSDPAALVRLMVGRDPGDLFPRWERRSSETVALSARGLVAEGVAGVDLEVRYGEVLGLGGLLGQGQEETLLALYGDLPRRGEVLIDGAASAPRSPMRANRRGIAYVPADRKREALLLPLPIRFNLVLPSLRRLARRGFRRLAAEAAARPARSASSGSEPATRRNRRSSSRAATSRRSRSPAGCRSGRASSCSTIPRAASTSRPSGRSTSACDRWRPMAPPWCC